MQIKEHLQEIRLHANSILCDLGHNRTGKNPEISACLWGILDEVNAIEQFYPEVSNGKSGKAGAAPGTVGQGVPT
jgi:hypothetical protein